MSEKIKNILKSLHKKYYKILLFLFYPEKKELVELYPFLIKGYIIPQKILNLNKCRNVQWPVHFTSLVTGNIKTGKYTAPGISPCCYIQGGNGIEFGDNIWIAAGVKIVSSNHDETNYRLHTSGKSIKIGNNVWIGANAIILPEVVIGDNVIIGAGSVVTHDIESNCIVTGNPARFLRKKEPYKG